MREWLLLAFAPFASACMPQGQCESTPPSVDYCDVGDPNCQGRIFDNGTRWESGPLGGNFLFFGAEQTIFMHYRDAVTGQVLTGERVDIEVDIGAVEKPNVLGGSYITGGEQLAALTDDLNGHAGLFVRNDTCQQYWVRVIVTLSPLPPVADAGTE